MGAGRPVLWLRCLCVFVLCVVHGVVLSHGSERPECRGLAIGLGNRCMAIGGLGLGATAGGARAGGLAGCARLYSDRAAATVLEIRGPAGRHGAGREP